MIASNLVVNGSSRFLNHVYMNDLSVAGTTSLSSLSLSGNLSVAGTTSLTGRVTVGGYNNTNYGLSANSIIVNNWIRTVGTTGWYNESHGGGWYMSDNNYIRSYGKPVMMGHNMYFGGTEDYYINTSGNAKFNDAVSVNVSTNHLDARTGYFSTLLRATEYDFQVSQA